MAWPRTRIIDFIARQTVIRATFLNALQDWIIAATLAEVSFKAIVVDGTGGQPAVPIAGDISCSNNLFAARSLNAGRAASGTSLPTPTLATGEIAKGGTVVGWAVITGNNGAGVAVLERGYGCISVTRTGSGHYDIVFRAVVDPVNVCPSVFLKSGNNARIWRGATADDGGGQCKVTIDLYDLADFNRDGDFTVSLLGE